MKNPATALLDRLLDRHERQAERVRRIYEKVPVIFTDAAEKEIVLRTLEDAARTGAIDIVPGRGELAHLIEKIALKDPARLYALLSRLPRGERVAAAAGELRRRTRPRTESVRAARDRILEGWVAGQDRPLGISWEDVDDAVLFLAALDAALAKDPADRSDLRTYSRRALGNSKAIERNAVRIAAFMRTTGQVDPQLADKDILTLMGLEKFPQPVLIAGPLRVRGTGLDLSGVPYAGVPPEAAEHLEPAGPIRSVLTIENLACFNRHVREAITPGDVVVFTGGFPSRAVMTALKAICRAEVSEIRHWGDIDPDGLRIADFLYRNLSKPVHLHLMSPDLARARGNRLETPVSVALSDGSPATELATFLAGPDAATLEQEEIDPAPPESAPRGGAEIMVV